MQAYYGREALVLPCPVDIDLFYVGKGEGRYALVISRLLPYKRIDLAIDGCALAGIPLIVVGTGPAQESLRAHAQGHDVTFLTQVNDEQRAKLVAEAKIVILPGEEDFGLVPIEAAAAGRPCIAYRKGGALETILDGITGAFFDEPTPESLAEALLKLDVTSYDPQRLREHAETFSPHAFTEGLQRIVDSLAAAGLPVTP